MSEDKVTVESLERRLFEVLQTNDLDKDQKILEACGNIATATMNLPLDKLDLYKNIHKYQLSKLNLDIKDLQKLSTVINDSFSGNEYQELRNVVDTHLTEELVKEAKKAQQAKLADRRKAINENLDFKAVKDLLRDKGMAEQKDFSAKGVKQAGVSAGYIAQEDVTDNTFILKQFYKSHTDCLAIKKQKKQTQALNDRRDGVQELIGSSLYQLLLYDRTPKEELVKPDQNNPNSLFVRSKFFDNVVQFSEFSGFPHNTGNIKADTKKLQKIEGFEKIIAACHMLGELDYHASNLMVQNGKTITKIDHGRSFIEFHQDFPAMIQATYRHFKNFGYADAIRKGNLSFTIEKYSESLKQMITQLDERQIEAIVDQRIAELQKAGFNPEGITTLARFRGGRAQSTPISNFADLKLFYKENIKENLTNMKEVAKSAEIVSKFSNVSPKFKKGQWVEALACSETQDPVVYASHYNIKIEGKNALQWAHENNYQIKVPAAPITKTIQEQQWQKNTADGKWQEAEVSVTKIHKTTANLDPVEYIIYAKDQLEMPLSQSETKFLSQAVALDISNVSGKTYQSMVEKSLMAKVSLDQGLKKKMHDQDQVVGDKLVPVIDNFVGKTLSKEITTERVDRFYDKLLTNLKAKNYLTDKDIADIKKDSNYKNNIQETTNLIKATTPDLTGGDKVCYKVANFCKKIGLFGLSNYFMKKIIPEKLDKIHKIEEALTESIKINEILLKPSGGKEGIQTKRLEAVKKITQSDLEVRRLKQKGRG
ncbi:MAG: phosphatidylinositol 4-kinase [Rickettsia endosymbiont of Pseudomimeciton antennatum]|nr:phosphatidylinositol 4-kinase [Rickettsia endosymbiont of Pseudomimeciton antennatum]